MYVCLLITLTRSPKAALRRAQLNWVGRMHMKGASGCRQTVMNEPGTQQPSQMFLTWVKIRPQHRELRVLINGLITVLDLVETIVQFLSYFVSKWKRFFINTFIQTWSSLNAVIRMWRFSKVTYHSFLLFFFIYKQYLLQHLL